MLTPSLIETQRDNNAALQKAMWLLAAVALNAIEIAIPRLPFFPWLKPGFANIITIMWIIKYGFKDAVLYTALRIWISGFYFGFSLFTFSLSISGGLLSTVVMSILWIAFGKRGLIGTVGMAMVGAMFHNAGQLAIVYLMMSQNFGVLEQFPFMLGASIVFGGIVGMLVPGVAKILDCSGSADAGNYLKKYIHAKLPSTSSGNGSDRVAELVEATAFETVSDTDSRQSTATFIDKFTVTLAFTVSISLMFITNIYILIAAATAFSLVALILNPRKPSVIIYPLKFYMLFLFIAFTYLLFSYGTRIEPIPFITQEGLSSFTKQTLRLWCWLQTAHIFKKFKFHEIFMSLLHKSFPNKQDTIGAGMIALEHFPEIARLPKSPNKKIPITDFLFRPGMVLIGYVDDVKRRIAGR
jgi:heptaprenyl diphosphate synthase